MLCIGRPALELGDLAQARVRASTAAFRQWVLSLRHLEGACRALAAWDDRNLGGVVSWSDRWLGVFSSLVGLAVGGGVIWAIRVIATLALQKEAMGFGDVTLMAMIGAFIGWQAAIIAFFLSPFAAILIVLVRYIITKDTYTPFGPYLCAGTIMAILGWDGLYNSWLAPNLFRMGTMMLWLCISMLGLMAAMLFAWRIVKNAILAR